MPDKPASEMQTILRVLPYLWPEAHPWVERRVIYAMIFLIAAKAVSIVTPYLYKLAVDSLSSETGTDPGWVLIYGAVGLTIAYGLARLGAVVFGEMRDAVFVRVGQRALRQLALETFSHIHGLGAIGSFVWLDLLYGIGICGGLPEYFGMGDAGLIGAGE